MNINLENGTFFEIGGELGNTNSIPVDYLVKIASTLQELIISLAQYDLPSDEQINLDNFKLELVDFKKGSAVPEFAFSQRPESRTGQNWQIHRQKVTEKFESLIDVSNSGDYSKLKVIYPEPIKRNIITENLYNFTKSFGSAPVTIGDYDVKKGEVVPIYRIKNFKRQVKESLITEIKELKSDTSEIGEGVGRWKFYKTKNTVRRRIVDVYKGKKITLEYAPEIIVFNDRKYILSMPLRCLFEKEDNYFVIQNELLNLIGTGNTEDEAEIDFAEEFDHAYKLLNELSDDNLTEFNKKIKTIINHFVEKIEE